MEFDPGAYRSDGDRYLRSYLGQMSRPAPWRMLETWAQQGVTSTSPDRPAPTPIDPWDIVLGQRDQNIVRFWDALRRIGFAVTDPEGTILRDEAAALRAPGVHLGCPERAPLVSPHRTGFFTHSVVGNALLLLTAPGDPQTGDIGRYPNRHYLDNASPIDLGHVVVIRHGQTQANARGILLGRSDSMDGWGGSLLDTTPRPCPAGVESWHCSSLTRTRQTAAVFGVDAPRVHPGLDEMDIGVAEGQPQRACVAKMRSVQLMQRGDPFTAIVDERGTERFEAPGECFVEVLIRVSACLHQDIGFSRAPRPVPRG